MTEHEDFTTNSGNERRRRGILAGLTALAVAGTGFLGTALPAAADEQAPAPAADPCVPVNPMGGATPIGSENGYTIFVSGDAIIANSELEGTLAVGGEARFGDPRGQQGPMYPIMHGGAGGSADYTVPTIGGEPNRVLIERFGSGSKVVQVKTGGAPGSSAQAGVKIADRSVPAGHTLGPAFGHSGTTFFPATGGNQSPQIDSEAQQWSDLALAEQSWSIPGTVLDEFPADAGASAISSFTDWQPIPSPLGSEPTITLHPDGPSKLALSDFAGVTKFSLADYSETSFLVVTVSPADVVGGRITLPTYAFSGNDSGHNQAISHILFDLSALSGEVEVVAVTDSVRGSIYAPNAHIVFPERDRGGQQFEGQLIAAQLTALQGSYELHTNLFKGRFPCSDEPTTPEGTFTLSKTLSGIDANAFPTGTTFPVTATWDGGSKEFHLPADGTTVPAGITLPEGTVVTLTEGDLPTAPEGYRFVSRSLSAPSITILAGDNDNISWTLTNTYAQTPGEPEDETGGFDLRKVLSGASTKDFPTGTTFTVTASWTQDGARESRDYRLPADGSTVTGARDLPAGTVVSFDEVRVPSADGRSFVEVKFSDAKLTVDADAVTTVTVTNIYRTPKLAVSGSDGTAVLAAGAALLLLAGGAVILLRRRRIG